MAPVTAETVVVHLVWAPLGVEPFARFMRSYREHPAGADHRLLLVFKEFRDDAHRAPWDAVAEQVDHDRSSMPEETLDLAAYMHVAQATDARLLCFLNSTCVILADDWLGLMQRNLDTPEVGMVGATGSWESAYSAALPWLKPFKRRHFDRFPSPHLRTNAFLIGRDTMLSLDWPLVADKESAHRLESGKRSVTRQIWERGLEVRVVGRDGRAYHREDWPVSATFRSGEQRNLLVADNRTLQYEQADPDRRRELARFAWGDTSPSS
jgi:hypothetical protein